MKPFYLRLAIFKRSKNFFFKHYKVLFLHLICWKQLSTFYVLCSVLIEIIKKHDGVAKITHSSLALKFNWVENVITMLFNT